MTPLLVAANTAHEIVAIETVPHHLLSREKDVTAILQRVVPAQPSQDRKPAHPRGNRLTIETRGDDIENLALKNEVGIVVAQEGTASAETAEARVWTKTE